MKLPIRITTVATCLLSVLAVPSILAVPVVASDPMGVYCLIDKVVLEPSDAAQRAQVHGVCAVANDEDWYFQKPARGYFYFSAPAGREAAARAEWLDLKSVAGTGQVVGFGRRYRVVGKFREDAERLGTPDEYPLHIGVVKVSAGRVAPEVTDVAAKLKAFKAR